MPTETFVSCAKAGWAGAKKTSAANKTALTIRHDLRSALRSSILGAFKLIQLRFSSAPHEVRHDRLSSILLSSTPVSSALMSSILRRFFWAVAETRQSRMSDVVAFGQA